MQTIVYFIRHTDYLKNNFYNEYDVNETWKKKDEKRPLSVTGESSAKDLLRKPQFNNIEVIYSSQYARCIATAKYLAMNLGLQINITEMLQERIHGDIEGTNPNNFYYNQHHDFDYKLPKGESINDTKKRIKKIFEDIIFTHYGKEIAIFTHEHVIISFLANYCEVAYNLDDELIFSYNDYNFTMPLSLGEVFKITLEGNKVMNIEKI